MTVTLLARRYLLEYARSPLNLILLALVPIVFVTLTAGALADFAEILGSTASSGALEANTAGWAAAFLAGIAAFFQVSGAHDVDRRLALVGTGAVRVVAGRLASSLGLAAIAAGGALVALAVRTGIDDPRLTITATLMFAVIYMAIGAAVGALVRDEVNGSVAVLFIWMLDVFLGPTMTGDTMWITRLFPTHFVSLVMVEAASGHGGPVNDWGWALIWTFGSVGAAGVIFALTTRAAGEPRGAGLGWINRPLVGFDYGFREYRRNLVLWVLLVIVPIVFITLALDTTPDTPTPVDLLEDGRHETRMLSMFDVHGAVMAPISAAFLAGLAGLFVVLGSAEGDRRLALTRFRAWEIFAARIGVIVVASVIVTAVSMAVTALDFVPEQWPAFAGGTLLIALTYAMLGVLIGPLAGRVGGLYLMFLIPFLDVGLAQNIMFDAAPPAWGKLFPAHAATRVLVDGAFTPSFDQWAALLAALAWLAAMTVGAVLVFRYTAEPERA